jgi:hypothetical protein
MSLTVNAKTFTASSFGTNAIAYDGPAHTLSVKDDIRLAKTAPKPTSTFSGVGRTGAKLTRTLTLTGALTTTGDAILDISVSVPVGAAGADVDSLLNDMGAFLSSASGKLWAKNLTINF